MIDDVLTVALFPQIGLKFLENRGNPDAFEPAPVEESAAPASSGKGGTYTVNVGGQSYVTEVLDNGSMTVNVNGQSYSVDVSEGGEVSTSAVAPAAASGESVSAPLAGNIFKVLVSPGQQVAEGEIVMILEAMKMETEISATKAGTIGQVLVKEGDSVTVGDALFTL